MPATSRRAKRLCSLRRPNAHEPPFDPPERLLAPVGGVARATRESLLLCDAAGFDLIVVETVGVGQSETVVQGMLDCCLVLLQAGGGGQRSGRLGA